MWAVAVVIGFAVALRARVSDTAKLIVSAKTATKVAARFACFTAFPRRARCGCRERPVCRFASDK
jgi:hypothetical protein